MTKTLLFFADGEWHEVSLSSADAPVTSVFTRIGDVVAVDGDYYGIVAAALTGATQAARFVGATTSGAPSTGTFLKGDFIVDQTGKIYICTVAGSPGTWVNAGSSGAVSSVFTRTGAVVAVTGDYYGVVSAALTGATSASRYVGATTSGAPTTGTFAVGDHVIDRTGKMWICTSAGSPGTWTNEVSGIPSAAAGAGLAEASDVLSVNVDASTIEISSDTLRVKDAGITEAKFSFSNVTTANVTTSRHGLVPILPNDSTKYFDGSGNYSVPAGTGGGGSGGGGSTVIFDSVLGSPATDIDTGASSIPAGYELLEIWIVARSDNAAAAASVAVTLNNDTGSNYDRQNSAGTNTSIVTAANVATASWIFNCHGDGGTANYPSVLRLTIPNYDATTFYKVGELTGGSIDGSAANERQLASIFGWRNTAAITRMKVTANGDNLKAGSRLLIIGRGGTPPGIPVGGTDGQVLTKQSGTDYDADWEDASGSGSSPLFNFLTGR